MRRGRREYDLALTAEDGDATLDAAVDAPPPAAGELAIEGYEVLADVRVALQPVLLEPAAPAGGGRG